MLYTKTMDWMIEYYVTPEGRCPIKDFIDSLSVEGQAKYIFITRLLQEYGIYVKQPYVKQITGHKKLYGSIRYQQNIILCTYWQKNLSYCTAL